jgi:CheY-like chemotaxis protein
LRILLAEDNPISQKLAVRLLEKRGHHVAVASDGRQALTALEKCSYDLVLMDVQMTLCIGQRRPGATRFPRSRQGIRGTPVFYQEAILSK